MAEDDPKPSFAQAQGCKRRRRNYSALGPYSITSSAIADKVGGRFRPSALAVFRLMTNSNLVGSITGRSAGLAPFGTVDLVILPQV
jgi:hypothetical protein